MDLYAVQGLEELETVASAFGVRFTVVGSVCRRILLAHTFRAGDAPKWLFDLAPFTSDINLFHDGDVAENAAIEAAIAETVPCAEAFRWRVMSGTEYAKFDRFLRQYAHRFPTALLRLDADGMHDEDGAADAYAKLQLHFELNPEYPSYPNSGVTQDLEMFSALFFLRILAEAQAYAPNTSPGDLLNVEDFQNVSTVMKRSLPLLVAAPTTGPSAYLRTRFAELALGFASACVDKNTFETLGRASGLLDILDSLNGDPDLRNLVLATFRVGDWRDKPVVISALVSDDRSRMPLEIDIWSVGVEAVDELGRFCGPEIARSDRAIMASGAVPVFPGTPRDSAFAGDTQEFVHIALPISPATATLLAGVENGELSLGIAIASGPDDPVPSLDDRARVFALPVVVDDQYGLRAPGGFIRIRVNCFGLLEHIDEISRKLGSVEPKIQMFLVRSIAGELGQEGVLSNAYQLPRVPARV